MVETLYPYISKPLKRLGIPRFSRESSLEMELPELVDNSASKSEIVLVFDDFGERHLVAPWVIFIGVV